MELWNLEAMYRLGYYMKYDEGVELGVNALKKGYRCHNFDKLWNHHYSFNYINRYIEELRE